jgi:hypothetical protein
MLPPSPVDAPQAVEPARRVEKTFPVRRSYLDKRVQRVIKEISFAYDVKAHDLYIEGINLMMRRYGKGTVADIAPDEET